MLTSVRVSFTPLPFTAVVVVVLNVLQWQIASSIATIPGFEFFAKLILLGIPVAHILRMCCTEAGKGLIWGYRPYDRWIAVMCNFTSVVPYAEPLRIYEMERRGCPTPTVPVILPKTLVRRVLYFAVQFPYNQLMSVMRRRGQWRTTEAHQQHIFYQLCLNAVIWYWAGMPTLLFLLASTLGAHCPLHPVASHWWMTATNQFVSDYGIVNLVSLNAGLVQERQQMPTVAWAHLPLIIGKRSSQDHWHTALRSLWNGK